MSYNLTEEDNKRIKGADFYEHAKIIMKSFDDYKHVNIGEVYHVSYGNQDGTKSYVRRYGSERKDKFMVVHKDDGFIFAKRINSSGGMSKDVVCLTIRFPSVSYTLELDDAQAESIIFSKEDEFDPFKEGKELSKKKNKARNLNNKKRIKFTSELAAYEFVKTLKVNDKIYDAVTGFGEGVVEWFVTDISITVPDKTPQKDWRGVTYAYGATSHDIAHNVQALDKCIILTIEVNGEPPKTRKYMNKKRTISFSDFLEKSRRDYYLTRPITIDEL